jgi:hypothetical protein
MRHGAAVPSCRSGRAGELYRLCSKIVPVVPEVPVLQGEESPRELKTEWHAVSMLQVSSDVVHLVHRDFAHGVPVIQCPKALA